MMALINHTKHLTNSLLGVLAFLTIYLILNTLLVNTPLGGGVGFNSVILDEIRIRLLPAPFGTDCQINQTHLQPGCEVTSHGYSQWIPAYEVRINNAGFRDQAYSPDKTADTYRILILGDSFTFGHGVDNDEVYTEVLERLLNQHSRTATFEVLNLGIPGAGTDTEYFAFQRYSNYHPDMILLQTFWNDPSECAASQKPLTESVDRCHCMRFYLKKIQDLAANLSAPLVIYEVNLSAPLVTYEVNHPDGSCLDPKPSSLYVVGGGYLGERRYSISREDGHPNREGHGLMALDLLPAILNITASQVRI